MGLGVTDRRRGRDTRDRDRALERAAGTFGQCSDAPAGAAAHHPSLRGNVYRRVRRAGRQIAIGLQLDRLRRTSQAAQLIG